MLGEVAVPGTVPDAVHPHLRKGTEAVGVRGHEQRACRGGQFLPDVSGIDRHAAQDARRRGRGHREDTVRAADRSAANIDR